MPLFKSREPEPAPEPVEETPNRKGSIFSRRYRSNSPTTTTSPTHTDARNNDMDTTSANTHNRQRSGGFFSRRRSSDDSSLGARSSSDVARSPSSAGSGFFGRNNRHLGAVHKDPTILAAREKVTMAEQAEAAADQALLAARTRVKEAKAHVLALEREAAEE